MLKKIRHLKKLGSQVKDLQHGHVNSENPVEVPPTDIIAYALFYPLPPPSLFAPF